MQLYELEKRMTMDIKYLAKLHDIKMDGILVNVQTHRGAYGAYWKNKWKNGETESDEIILNPEHFSEPLELLDTMLHELVHVYCDQNSIKDTSRAGYYHNVKFKKVAEQFGLKTIEDKAIGWRTTPDGNAEFLNKLNQELPYPITGDMMRKGEKKKGQRTPTKKTKHTYTCPLCGLEVKHKDLIFLKCWICEMPLEMVADDEKDFQAWIDRGVDNGLYMNEM